MEQLELNDITFNELFILKSYNLKNSSIEYLEVCCLSYKGEIYKKMLEKLIAFNSLK